jgi:hypothetical protein
MPGGTASDELENPCMRLESRADACAGEVSVEGGSAKEERCGVDVDGAHVRSCPWLSGAFEMVEEEELEEDSIITRVSRAKRQARVISISKKNHKKKKKSIDVEQLVPSALPDPPRSI